ncbi:Shedu anti-phage system protein SduA domain-containing protein [Planococcus sp. 1R117A]|uniref:Shedu anti-phage system protein SduA domain-containing protein n=1 Tax=Planococcus sp. 1R117A TaxID=3447020 RepID=UPI003EDB81DA
MNTFERDYSKLTQEELEIWESIKLKEEIKIDGQLFGRKNLFREYPKAVRHYLTLFPNNYLDIEDLKKEEELSNIVQQFKQKADEKDSNERTILNFIKENKAYFIIGSILKRGYSFGHHDAYIFPEFQLGNSFQVDYLLVGKNSDGFHFVFVELEHPNGNATIKNGHLGDAFRKGLNQVADWEVWLENYYSSLRESFQKKLNPNKQLPPEFYNFDPTRLHYVVVAGKREDFNEMTRKIRRKKQADRILLLHYENLIDSAEYIIGESNY